MVESGEPGTTLHCLVPLTAGAHVGLPDFDAGTLQVEPTCVAVDGKVIESDRSPHPDTITRRLKELAGQAGLPGIGPHDVRHRRFSCSATLCAHLHQNRVNLACDSAVNIYVFLKFQVRGET